MCAIAGMIGLQPDKDSRSRMLKTMARRGPDGQGSCSGDGWMLLHTRLAVIDPEGGKQPMVLTWHDEEYTISYNGELYNACALRQELECLGHRFLTHSDTEVILHSYAQWGAACLHRMNGIFAFVLWETKRKRLFLARDRIGVKPLFYHLRNGGLLFASEIKTILTYPGVKAQLDAEGATQLIMLGPGRLPGSGIFRNIHELEPGCCGYFENGNLSINRYWKLTDREHLQDFAQTSDHVRYLVKEAIRGQMVSDVPIGTFLSGGLDSSIISAVCAGEMTARGERLRTFSVDYLNNEQYFTPGKFQPNADGEFIRLMQSVLDTKHSWTVLTPQQLVEVLEDATEARDLPGMADVDFSLLAFCKEIRKDVKVALSGECADEIFGGYPWYRDPQVRSREGFPWSQNAPQRAQLLLPTVSAQVEPTDFVMDAYKTACAQCDILPETPPEDRRIKQMVNLNFQFFMQTLLDRKDRMSMYCGLEVRVPFCDYRIAEYLYGVPWELKDYSGREKGLLRHAMEGLLPEQVLYRKKSPYPKTFDPKYEQLVHHRLHQLVHSDAPMFDLINREALTGLLSQEAQWPWYGQLMRKPQTMAYFLQLDYWLRRYQVELLF